MEGTVLGAIPKVQESFQEGCRNLPGYSLVVHVLKPVAFIQLKCLKTMMLQDYW